MAKKSAVSHAKQDKAGRAPVISESNGESVDFVKGLVVRGEAAPVSSDGRLPDGATHQIVGYDDNGLPLVKRLRFSLQG